ncbi:hypothetical protein C5L31_001572 [Secundilactobacillus malefermentans]|uniref:Uncharacterized protein n=1 Tax=Secundilactobacillus malefermentans TaxID=176292 RepID=A0A4R5NRK5_9LACO|nr:hypothetical protein [Secundilactobacillus malefermentans]KRM57225.1 hypothetical protein FD44_GL001301 [Secundilactobacillus malefermentans DSM 5705 = KCTC 3548]TDG79661.1 hypothetical protein C5L31_001572 [Secundilactobacillus malefermentans]
MSENNGHDETNEEITPGSPEFEKMVFKLSQGVNAENLSVLNYNGNELHEIQEGVYTQPVYITDDFNLFFLVIKLIGEDWIVAFAHATIENNNEITDFSEALPTGVGLNMLGEKSPEDANNVLQYFNTLVEANRGEWRLIQ